jgi:hypothetical protein
VPPVARCAPALALACLALAACGGGGTPSTTEQSQAQQAHAARWSAGLRRWGTAMRGAIDGLSLAFSRPADVQAIQAGEARVRAVLHRYETTLAGCTVTVNRLGEAPAALELARREAVHACVNLERGGRLVQRGVAQLERGLGPELLSAASEPLGAGEDGVRRALLDLRPAA